MVLTIISMIIHCCVSMQRRSPFQIALPVRLSAAYSCLATKRSRNTLRRFISSKYFSIYRSVPTMMPEGPEVRLLVDQLQPIVGMRLVDFQFLSGKYVRHGRPMGFDAFAKTMTQRRSDTNVSSSTEESSNSGSSTVDPNIYENGGNEWNDGIDVITALKCKGKFIYVTLNNGRNIGDTIVDNDYQRSIWITLGMTGHFLNQDEVDDRRLNNDNKVGPRWCIEVMDTKRKTMRKIYYQDPRNFGTLRFSLSAQALGDKLSTLGPDILDFDNTTEDTFLECMEKSSSSKNICKFLMDQRNIAGVGNYILSEGLYRARIDPFADLSEIDLDSRRTLFKELRNVSSLSYTAQGLTRSNGGLYRGIDGERGKFEFQLQCYGQSVSPNNNPVVKEVNGPHSRAIWFVEEEQLFMPRSQRVQKVGSDDDYYEGSELEIDDSETSLNKKAKKHSFRDVTVKHLTEPSWKNVLSNHMMSDSFQSLVDKIESDIKGGAIVYPPLEDIFSALNLCPLDGIKCVIVGQDPYHQAGQGHGLAFSVRKGVKPPPSLRNIYKEAIDDVGIDPPQHGNLEYWARQGVLLLNTVLTVRQGEANSHAKLGWEEFTDLIINVINDRKDSVVFLLWGLPAAKKASCVDEKKHTVIRTSHPSPLGATKTNSPFLGSHCFSRANDALDRSGKGRIDWNIK